MSRKSYVNVKNSMHVYSRSPLAEGQLYIDQATAKSGHKVSIEEVRVDRIPKIATIAERDSKYLTTSACDTRIVGGPLGRDYVSILKFIDFASLKEIPNSNGEAFMVVNEFNEPYLDWIDPSDAPISQYILSEGYAVRLFSEDKTKEIQRNYGWDFDAFNGILHFSSMFKPGTPEWEAKDFGMPKIEGFIYTGKHMSDIINGINDSMTESIEEIETALADCLTIQPFKFSSNIMQKIGDPYQINNTGTSFEGRDWFQTLTFIVPGYCFELTSLDRDETILTEMRHLSTGDTQIFIDLPWDMNYDQPIIRYAYESGVDGQGPKFPVIGKYKFIATTFVAPDGHKIPVKPVIDFDLTPSVVPQIPAEYSYHEDEEQGMVSPYLAGTYVGEYPGGMNPGM